MAELDFFQTPPPVPGVTDVGSNQKAQLERLSSLFNIPNRFVDAKSTFEEGMRLLGQAAKEDPRLTPIVGAAMRLLSGTGHDVPMQRRPADRGVSDLPLPGGTVKVKGA